MQTSLRLFVAVFGLAMFNVSTVMLEAQSYTNTYGVWDYTTTNGTITITGYTGSGGDVVIPGTINGLPVTSIGDYSFAWCSLTSVTIPNSLTSIGNSAFWECRSLTNVTIPNSVTSIGERAFMGCSSLTAIKVAPLNSFYSSVDGVLFDKSQTTLVEYPAGIGGSYTIPNGITTIGNSAFSGCISLTSVIIPNSVTSIGEYAFNGCGLTSVTIPNSVTSVGDYSFEWCGLTSVTIGNGVISIGNSAFVQCDSLTNITIPNSVTNIGDSAFEDCTSLTSVTLGNGVISIGNSAFAGCWRLSGVTIPNSVTNIGAGAFRYCTAEAITVDTNNPAYRSVNGVLFNKSQTTLVEYPTDLGGSYTLPNSVTNLGDSAFAGCFTLTSVYFQGNAPSFGINVFEIDIPMHHWDDPVTIYYLPGTTGWSTNFAGRPTALWLPQVQTSDASFGVRSNQFGFNINWASGMTVVVEASPTLSNPNWSPVATNTLSSGSCYFSDPQWTNYPARVYRIRSL